MRWWNQRSETVRDAVGAIPLILIFVVGQQAFADGQPLPRAILIVIAIAVAMSVRRRWPMATFATALLVAMTAQTGLEFLSVAGYSLVVYEPRAKLALVAAASAAAAFVGYLQYWPAFVLADIGGDLAIIAVVAILPVIVGRLVRQYRLTTMELASRNAELLALREQEAQHAVQTERLRIARELHDVVAHHVGAMTVRARAGRHVAAKDPQAATDALGYIADSGTETLAAMRTFVGALREGGARDTDGVEGFAPQPGLDDLPALLESFRGTGLVVHADLQTPDLALPPTLGLNAYRIVQEGLTNVIRHGAAERAWVRVWSASSTLNIQIDDNGRGIPADRGRPAGHGLIGVAERVALHNGRSGVGPSPKGGCRLEATLQIEGLPAPDEARRQPVVRP